MKRERKTEIRIAKSGRKYWYNPDAYRLEKERLARKKNEEPAPLIGYDGARTTVYCYDNKNESYMKYYDTKCKIRSEYPAWKEMDREHWLEYMSRILTLIYTDVDYAEYKVDTKTMEEKSLDDKWEERNRKEEDYDGRWDDYHL